jgi:hypothetical protein
MGGEEIPLHISKKIAVLNASGVRVRDLRLPSFPSEKTSGTSFLFRWSLDKAAEQVR